MDQINQTLKLLIQLANSGELNPWGICSIYLLVELLIIGGGVVFLFRDDIHTQPKRPTSKHQ